MPKKPARFKPNACFDTFRQRETAKRHFRPSGNAPFLLPFIVFRQSETFWRRSAMQSFYNLAVISPASSSAHALFAQFAGTNYRFTGSPSSFPQSLALQEPCRLRGGPNGARPKHRFCSCAFHQLHRTPPLPVTYLAIDLSIFPLV